MMKKLLILAALLSPCSFAQPINVLNNPNQPGFVNPSEQRMQTQMQSQQIQQKGMLNQQLQTQTRVQQQHLESQINTNTQRIRESAPGELNPQTQQMLPNTSGSMLNNGSSSQERMLDNQQHMLPGKTNGDMLRPNNGTLSNQGVTTMPQPNIPLKTIGP